MKKRHYTLLGLIIAFALFSALSFRSALTPYVTFAQARGMSGGVQVKGTVVADSIVTAGKLHDPANAAAANLLDFRLRDENGEELPVSYAGVKPEGFEAAEGVVAIGRCQEGRFVADKLLVKCPSKYQENGSRP